MLVRLLAVLLAAAGASLAHQIDEITLELEAAGGQFHAEVMADAAYMLPEFRGDADIAPQDLAWLRTRTPEEWLRIRLETEKYLRESLAFRVDGQRVPCQFRFPDFESEPPRFMREGVPEMLPMLTVALHGDYPGGELQVGWKEPLGVVLIVQAGGEAVPLVSGETQTVMRRDPGESAHAVAPRLAKWIQLGFVHIVPRGVDHILFVLGIFLLTPKWKPLLAQTLIFTLAHSVTLGLAAAGIVRLPAAPVEVGIALSLVWIGVENLWQRDREPGRFRYALVGAFGLVHGLGFASMLTEYLPADRPVPLLTGLLGFNLGVEAGQLTVLAAAFALFAWWRKPAFDRLRVAGSLLVAAAGAAMAVDRLGGPSLVPGI